MENTTKNDQEIENFNALAHEWWDENGPMRPLHRLNPERIRYIKQQITSVLGYKEPNGTLKGLKILDVGCGAGIVDEPLARLGADVTGVDAATQSIAVAQAHAKDSGLKIDYRNTTVEEIAESGETYDVVLALEIIEHVENIPLFIEKCAKCAKPGGLVIFSTLNRNPKSYLLGIVAAEHILKWVPKGTHDWRKFVKPSELSRHAETAGLTAVDVTGLKYNPFSKSFSLDKKDLDVNYFMSFQA